MDRISTAIKEGKRDRSRADIRDTGELDRSPSRTVQSGIEEKTNPANTAGLALPIRLFLLSTIIPIQFQIGPLVMSGTRLFLLLMFIPVFLRSFARTTASVLFIEIMFVFHVLWAFLALAANNPDRIVENAGSTAVDFLGAFLLGQSYIRSSQQFNALCRLLIICVGATLPFALIESFTGRAVLMELVNKIPFISSYFFVGDIRMGLHRAQVAFPHSILYGVFCSMAFTVCILSLRNAVSGSFRLVFGLIIAICTFLSLSSGALLALMVQNVLLIWSFILRQIRQKWVILSVLLISCYVAVDLLSNRSPIQVFMSYATFSPGTAYMRSIIFDYGMQNVLANPWFGLGLKDWARPPWLHSASVDNFWLLMAMRYGILGFLFLFIGYFFGLFKVCLGGRWDTSLVADQRQAWVFTIISLTLSLTTVHVWGSVYSLVFFFFGSGMWLLVKPDSSTEGVKTVAEGTV